MRKMFIINVVFRGKKMSINVIHSIIAEKDMLSEEVK